MQNDYRRVLALPFDTAVGVHFDQMDAEAFRGFVPWLLAFSRKPNSAFAEESMLIGTGLMDRVCSRHLLPLMERSLTFAKTLSQSSHIFFFNQ